MGKIVTFYSYKGGTGRSMALANVAWALASNQNRVLAIDWDLEAPGLHRYFRPFLADKDLTEPESKGLIEFVRNYALMAATPPAEGPRPEKWYEPHAEIWKWAAALRWPRESTVHFGTRGEIQFVPAGRQVPEYAERVNTFDWHALYRDHAGERFFQTVRDKAKAEFDYVLIDSRTGVSDTSGICTIQMPDILVVCYTYNLQSIEGASDIARRVRNRRPDVTVFPVAMRVEFTESAQLRLMRRLARARFGEFVPRERDQYFDEMEVPYFPSYAFWERLAAFEDRPNAKGSINRDIRDLTGLLVGTQVTQIAIGEARRQTVEQEFQHLPLSSDVDVAPEKQPVRWDVLVWATISLACAAVLAVALWREPSPGERKSQEIAVAASNSLSLISQVGALLETANLPESTAARALLKNLVKAGIPTFVDYAANGSLEDTGGRLITCGFVLRVWTSDGKPLIADTPTDQALNYCALVPGQNRAVGVTVGGELRVYDWPSDDPRKPAVERAGVAAPSSPGFPSVLPAVSRDGKQFALVRGQGGSLRWTVWDLSGATVLSKPSIDDSLLRQTSPPLLPVSGVYSSLYTTVDGFVYGEASSGALRLFREGDQKPFATVNIGAVSGYALNSRGTQIATSDGHDLQIVDVRTGQKVMGTSLNPSEYSPGSMVLYSPTDEFIAITTPTGFEIRSARDLAVVWAVQAVQVPAAPNSPSALSPLFNFLASSIVNLDVSGNIALASFGAGLPPLQGSPYAIFRHDRKLPDPALPWGQAIGQLRAYTTICLQPADRISMLLETQDEANARFGACEIGQGRILPSPNLSIAQSHMGDFVQGRKGTYTVTVGNASGWAPTSGAVKVIETVTSGLKLASMSGQGWTCPSGSNTCTRSDSLLGGISYPPITVALDVATNAGTPQVSSVSVSGGGSPAATATDSTVINPASAAPPGK